MKTSVPPLSTPNGTIGAKSGGNGVEDASRTRDIELGRPRGLSAVAARLEARAWRVQLSCRPSRPPRPVRDADESGRPDPRPGTGASRSGRSLSPIVASLRSGAPTRSNSPCRPLPRRCPLHYLELSEYCGSCVGWCGSCVGYENGQWRGVAQDAMPSAGSFWSPVGTNGDVGPATVYRSGTRTGGLQQTMSVIRRSVSAARAYGVAIPIEPLPQCACNGARASVSAWRRRCSPFLLTDRQDVQPRLV